MIENTYGTKYVGIHVRFNQIEIINRNQGQILNSINIEIPTILIAPLLPLITLVHVYHIAIATRKFKCTYNFLRKTPKNPFMTKPINS